MLTDEHEHAMKVWREADRAGEDAYVEAVETGTTAVEAHEAGNRAAAAVIAREFEALEADNAMLREALFEIVGPLNVCSDNPNVPDDTLIPVDITMGEIRKSRAALKGTDHGPA